MPRRILCLLSSIAIVISFAALARAADSPTFVGKFMGDGLSVDVTDNPKTSGEYLGVIVMGEQRFPLRGTVDMTRDFNGKFTSEGKEFTFTLKFESENGTLISLATADATYHLKRQNDDNPLAKKKPPEAAPAPAPNPLAKKDAPKPDEKAAEKPAAKKDAKAIELDRPSLVVTQGQYFRWAGAKGWTVNETTNGVDLLSPDKTMGASSTLVVASMNPTPRQWLDYSMKSINVQPKKVIEVKDLPDQPLGNGAVFKTAMQEQLVEYQGTTYHQIWVAGVVPGGGASTLIYSAADDKWEKARLWLPIVAQSVTMTKRGFALPSLPKNNPMDHDLLMESWRQKGLSEDRISQAQRESTMGYERMKDPETGTLYNMPLETYDGTRGGYVNPERPDEILQKAETGE